MSDQRNNADHGRSPGEGSITCWIDDLRRGNPEAAGVLWQRFHERLVGLASRKLGGANRRVADEDDVVNHAFHSFCRGAAGGRFPKLEDREDLWQVLIMLTARKAADQIKGLCRDKRGGGDVRGESIFVNASDAPLQSFDQVVDGEPTPEFASQLAEEFRLLLDALDDETLRSIAIARMEGFSNDEIAVRLQVQTRTIERKLKLIREIWGSR
jgi:DNA-directed RNA polymerase specialized sigma24 family protein